VVLTGHEHNYERFAKMDASGNASSTGIRQFIVGTGGKSFRSMSATKPNSEVRMNDTHGVLKMVLRPDGYDFEFLPVAGKTWTDRGSGACN
jgi:hypothetical protein